MSREALKANEDLRSFGKAFNTLRKTGPRDLGLPKATVHCQNRAEAARGHKVIFVKNCADIDSAASLHTYYWFEGCTATFRMDPSVSQLMRNAMTNHVLQHPGLEVDMAP